MSAPEFNRPYSKALAFELFGGDYDQLNKLRDFNRRFKGMFNELSVRIVKGPITHRFFPYGLSMTTIFEESHAAAHSWPEKGYMSGYMEVCSKDVEMNRFGELLDRHFKNRTIILGNIERLALEKYPLLPKRITTQLSPHNVTIIGKDLYLPNGQHLENIAV